MLVFVIKCGGLTEVMRKQYGCLHDSFCDSKVPIVIIVTGCENVRPTMDTWWMNNESSFKEARMSFDGHACVHAAFEGKYGGSNNQGLESESVEVLRRLIVEHCMPNGWKKKKV